MADLTNSIDEIIDVDKLFDLLDITADEQATISDGEISYNFFTISDIDDGKKEILGNIGFKEFKESIFFIEGGEIRTKEALNYLLPLYQQKEIECWDEIIEKLVNINEKGIIIFNPSSKQLRIVSKWKGKIVQNEDEFMRLVLDLNHLFRESCKNGTEYRINDKCRSHDFWKIIGNLRNYCYSHDPEQWSEDKVKEYSEKVKSTNEFLFSSPTVKKTPIDFLNAQFKLFNTCLDFLELTAGEI
ncbi:MAG: hypothetical protein C3F06_04265 [Candidatus Methanoperedenaceae archaeon]|nr:MAG: hypothetical protein C3F06_04265 [Candidatus Methanoperedenaceae archaeon]